MLLILDIHRNILSAQCFLKYETDYITDVEIKLEPSKLCLSFCKDSKSRYLNLTVPEQFLLPSTVSSMSCNASKECSIDSEKNSTKLCFPSSNSKELPENNQALEATFRIQVSSTALKNFTYKSDSHKDFRDFMCNKLKQSPAIDVICSYCGNSLTENNLSFQSVGKYYDGISELSETCFCHRHGEHNSVETEKVNSLYIGDMYFYFHDSVIKTLALLETLKEFKCEKCSSVLSRKKKMDNPHFIGFFCDKVMLVESKSQSKDVLEKYTSEVALFSISCVIQDLIKSAVSWKMYLQCKVGETTEVLLLWINLQNVLQFLFLLDEEEREHKKEDKVKEVRKVDEEKTTHEEEFKVTEVYKVLYCACPSNSELSRKWKHDFAVEFFQISDNTMKVLKELLQKSSKYFPEGQTVKGFSLGYLPAYVSMA